VLTVLTVLTMPVKVTPLSESVTVPVGTAPPVLTRDVKVTFCPYVDGLRLELSWVTVLAGLIVIVVDSGVEG
jgi:hypothetical protein